MVFQVPQFIDTEDKIIGPLTLKQFGYVGAAGAVCFVLYFMLPLGLWLAVAALFFGTAVAFAFVKVNGRPLSVLAVASLHYFWGAQKYIWQPEKSAMSKAALKPAPGAKFAIEKIVSGLALKNAFRAVQTGSVFKEEQEEERPAKRGVERYQIFRAATGENRAARRVDYR